MHFKKYVMRLNKRTAKKMKGTTKPPIGIKPKIIHDTNRCIEILQAIERYLSKGMKIPNEWRNELDSLLDILEEGID